MQSAEDCSDTAARIAGLAHVRVVTSVSENSIILVIEFSIDYSGN